MAGFNVISSNYSPEFFGNGIVSLLLENGYHILCIKDRGIYECVFEYKNKLRCVLIPIQFLVETFPKDQYIGSFSFQDREHMLEYLEVHKKDLEEINERIAKRKYREWKGFGLTDYRR